MHGVLGSYDVDRDYEYWAQREHLLRQGQTVGLGCQVAGREPLLVLKGPHSCSLPCPVSSCVILAAQPLEAPRAKDAAHLVTPWRPPECPHSRLNHVDGWQVRKRPTGHLAAAPQPPPGRASPALSGSAPGSPSWPPTPPTAFLSKADVFKWPESPGLCPLPETTDFFGEALAQPSGGQRESLCAPGAPSALGRAL